MDGDAVADALAVNVQTSIPSGDLARVRRAVGQRPALVTRRYRDRPRRVRHRQPIRAGAVEAAVEARDANHIRARDRGHNVVDDGRTRARRIAQSGTSRTRQPYPRPEVVVVDDLADVHRDPLARNGVERPGVDLTRNRDGSGVQGPVDERTSVILDIVTVAAPGVPIS